MKKQTKARSLQKLIFGSVLSVGFLLVAFYTAMITGAGEEGMFAAVDMMMQLEVSAYAKEFKDNPDTPLPSGSHLTTYTSYKALPQYLQQTATAKHLQEEGLFISEHDDAIVSACVFSWKRQDGVWLYLVHEISIEDLLNSEFVVEDFSEEFEHGTNPEEIAALCFLTVIGLLVIFLFRHIGKSVDDLRNWAENLSFEKLNEQQPSFKYKELNALAELFYTSARKLGEGVERERRFLQNASHELRTPVAIMKSNLELLERKELHNSPQLAAPHTRMKNSVHNMQHIITTLLWASRKHEDELPSDTIEIDVFLHELINENTYLITGKDVELTQALSKGYVHAPKDLLRIILNNIVRNAFQHTYEGNITLTATSDVVIITNTKSPDSEGHESDSYGLGIMLVEQLVEKIGWEVRFEETAASFSVLLHMTRKGPQGEPTDA